MKRYITFCTAGHIDHGKSALLEALTGENPDVRPEEIERGITLDLGFSFLPVNDEEIAIIDVPGHEDLLRTMIAGASSIDFFLLTVSADEGIMPQTIEHIEVLNTLGIEEGIAVITKIDLADDDLIEIVHLEITDYLKKMGFKDIQVIRTSSITGEGIDELGEVITGLVETAEGRRRNYDDYFFLPIDRVFSLKGIGTVVAGTVSSGKYEIGDSLELLPYRAEVRIRRIQTHSVDVEEVVPGQRASFNLPGVEVERVKRGDTLAEPGAFTPTSISDIYINLSPKYDGELSHNERVRFMTDTSLSYGRISLLEVDSLKSGQSVFAQIKLEEKIVMRWGNPFVICNFATLRVMGGGIILDPHPNPHRRKKKWVIDSLERLKEGGETGFVEEVLRGSLGPGVVWSVEELSGRTQFPVSEIKEILGQLERDGRVLNLSGGGYLHSSLRDEMSEAINKTIGEYIKENPIAGGMDLSILSTRFDLNVDDLLQIMSEDIEGGTLLRDGNLIYPEGRKYELTRRQAEIEERIRGKLNFDSSICELNLISEGDLIESFEAYESDEVVEIIEYLESQGEIVRLFGNLMIIREALEYVESETIRLLEERGSLRAKDFKDLIEVSRRQATALLDYINDEGLTVRVKGTHYLPGDEPEQ